MHARTTILTIALTLFIFMGCSDNPVEVDDHEEDLSVSLNLSDDHIHTLSPVTFTAAVQDGRGMAFTDFDTLRVERQAAGDDKWRAIDLTRTGNTFAGEYMFMSSGTYHLRVAGRTHGHDHMEVLHTVHDPIEVARTHEVVGDFRIEFENYPGHLHEGTDGTVKFWIMAAEKDANGDRAPIAGMNATIHCTDASGKREEHTPVESGPGIYEATHIFEEAGEAHIKIVFKDAAGQDVEADFHLPVAHGH